MAKLPALIDALAELDARGRPTIEHVARLVREAGYIQTTKRGRGAADMTAADVAALLIGLNAIENPVDAAKQVALFSELPGYEKTRYSSTPLPPDLQTVLSAKTFIGALEALFLAVPTLERLQSHSAELLTQIADADVAGFRLLPRSAFSLDVKFTLPGPIAGILARWMEPNKFSNEEAVLVNGFFRRYAPKDPKRHNVQQLHGDRRVTVEFGLKTLSEVYRVLWPAH